MLASQARDAGPIPVSRFDDSIGIFIADVAQLVEQGFRKAKVPGSNPGGGFKQKTRISLFFVLLFIYSKK